MHIISPRLRKGEYMKSGCEKHRIRKRGFPFLRFLRLLAAIPCRARQTDQANRRSGFDGSHPAKMYATYLILIAYTQFNALCSQTQSNWVKPIWKVKGWMISVNPWRC